MLNGLFYPLEYNTCSDIVRCSSESSLPRDSCASNVVKSSSCISIWISGTVFDSLYRFWKVFFCFPYVSYPIASPITIVFIFLFYQLRKFYEKFFMVIHRMWKSDAYLSDSDANISSSVINTEVHISGYQRLFVRTHHLQGLYAPYASLLFWYASHRDESFLRSVTWNLLRIFSTNQSWSTVFWEMSSSMGISIWSVFSWRRLMISDSYISLLVVHPLMAELWYSLASLWEEFILSKKVRDTSFISPCLPMPGSSSDNFDHNFSVLRHKLYL